MKPLKILPKAKLNKNLIFRGLAVLIITLLIPPAVMAEDYQNQDNNGTDFKVQTQRIDLSGEVGLESYLNIMQSESAFYRISFQDNPPNISDYLLNSSTGLYLNGDFTTKKMGVHFKTFSLYQYPGNTAFQFNELFGNVNLKPISSLQAGKIIYKWGKGYAFNPTGYVNPIKDPRNPDLVTEGILSLNLETISSFQNSSLQTTALNFIILPESNSVNEQYWELEDTGLAAKIYYLINGIDLDIMEYYRKDGPKYTGIDTAISLTDRLEAHGEFSYGTNVERKLVSNTGQLDQENIDICNYLLGFRYTANEKTNILIEYYHNTVGMTTDEYVNFADFLEYAARNPTLLQQAGGLIKQFSGPTLMQDYAYLRITKDEMFGLIYLTGGMSAIVNLNDNSFTMGPQITYTPFSNTEFFLKVSSNNGGSKTEYGDKPVKIVLDLGMKCYF